jgi:hypothetical protein
MTRMSFLDKAKEKATQLTQQAKEKFDDFQDTRKADELLDDLGRILYRQRTGRAETTDETRIAELVAALQALEAEGTDVLAAKPASSPAAPSAPTAGDPLPPPPSAPLPPPPMPT